MNEYAKSLFLLLLVVMSLFLTYQLWYGQKPTELTVEDVYERVVFEQPRPLEDAIAPSRIVADIDDANYVFQKGEQNYDDLWSHLSSLMKDLDKAAFVDQSSPDEEAVNCLTFYFQTSLPVGGELPWFPETVELEVDKVKLYCLVESSQAIDNEDDPNVQEETIVNNLDDQDETNEPDQSNDKELTEEDSEEDSEMEDSKQEVTKWLVIKGSDVGTEMSVLLTEELTGLAKEDLEQFRGRLQNIPTNDLAAYHSLTEDMLSEQFDRNIQLRNPIYIPKEPFFINHLTLKPEKLVKEALLKTFFVDYNMARVIEERDGHVIYTDGEKGLRLTDVGLEYSNPRHEEGQATMSYHDALLNISNLISNHGGWPDGLQLKNLELSRRAGYSFYQAEWVMYHEGYPLYADHKTRISFNDLGLFDYTRSLFIVENDGIEESMVEANDQNNVEEESDIENEEAVEEEEGILIAEWNEALHEAIKLYDGEAALDRTSLRLESFNLQYVVTGSLSFPRGEPVWSIKLNGKEFLLKVGSLEQISEEDML